MKKSSVFVIVLIVLSIFVFDIASAEILKGYKIFPSPAGVKCSHGTAFLTDKTEDKVFFIKNQYPGSISGKRILGKVLGDSNDVCEKDGEKISVAVVYLYGISR